MIYRYRSGFSLDDNVIKGSKHFSYSFFYYTTISYFSISLEGIADLMLSESGMNWFLNWETPYNPCDNYGCLKGYVPKSDDEWSKGNWTGGCVRKTKFFCDSDTSKSVSTRTKENDDGFWKIIRLKVPDSHELVLTTLDTENTPDDCKIWCLNNCSCLAYAFVNKIGCLVWSKDLIDIQQFSFGGEDLYVRLAQAELGNL
ncbi:putative non-specific serine/threonine protein kinase [Rosa chinensis]|uniref:Putative non-specific serine/threonine protein kinase n=1 Tax=Rosa chinensis TaxID=74649 RepID=A0A2P6REY3_ROSCH|nr:putative non-specific serine/threonine protein kinase [Rosa chinensis]